MNEYLEAAVVAGLSTLGAVIGIFMQHLDNGKRHEIDLDKVALAAGAGLAAGLLGQGLYVNKPFIVGSSIIVGYAGGKRFFEWALRLLSLLTRRRFASGDSDDSKLPALGDEENKEDSDERRL